MTINEYDKIITELTIAKLQAEIKRLRKELLLYRRVIKLYRLEGMPMVTSDYRDKREEIIKGIQDCIAG